ncbi:unnamed protein product [Allacma fusca]|uniref:Uncharacterized protein n=1 Tax=Allacma fusca TaxID=39272 RepID=A0A8J2JRY4_9HEXA|nr:unnamed protein product [Allacma fusca]
MPDSFGVETALIGSSRRESLKSPVNVVLKRIYLFRSTLKYQDPRKYRITVSCKVCILPVDKFTASILFYFKNMTTE